MNFKLSNLSVINEKYDRIIELLKYVPTVAVVLVIVVLTGCNHKTYKQEYYERTYRCS